MNFAEALEIVKNIVTGSIRNEYDGIIVKQLGASNTLDKDRSSNQTHIAISGEQMDMFPYIRADGYFERNYDDKDEELKKYFITQIPLYIYQDNVEYLSGGSVNNIVFTDGKRCVRTSIVRSRRKEQANQMQMSLISTDDQEFVAFRKLLHENDYLILMKHKEKLLYDCFGVKAEDETNGEFRLLLLNNKFYKVPTNTKVDIEKNIEIVNPITKNRDFTIQDLGAILWKMYSNAEDKTQVALIIIFGIKYGKEIIENNFKIPDIIKAAGLNDSYASELYKGVNIYKCLDKHLYGLSITDGKSQSQERRSDINRRTGAENIILYGVPGSGKSHEIKTHYCSDYRYMERVVFHPDYMYSDFVGQILPRVGKDAEGNDKLEYVFTAGPFTRMLRKAETDPEHYYYLVIEELNRGNAPAIFGEIFQLLDRKEGNEFPQEEVGESEYAISNYDIAKAVYGDENHPVRIPSNMYILATMNTADQNVFTMDTAFQRRWTMKPIENRFDKSEHSNDLIAGTEVNWGTFATVINNIITHINIDVASSEDKRLGTYFVKKRELEADRFPQKVLKYLWDDAFKLDKTAIFNENYKSLEEVVAVYEAAGSDKLSAVLQPSVYGEMLAKMGKNNTNDMN